MDVFKWVVSRTVTLGHIAAIIYKSELFVLRFHGDAMSRAYDEIVEFIAAGSTSQTVAGFEASEETKAYVADLIHREKTVGLSSNESTELDHFLKFEHLMRLAKARARTLCSK